MKIKFSVVLFSSRYLVGVLDKESGKMKVYDAKSHQLRPWFGDSSKASECITEGGEQEKLTYSEKVFVQTVICTNSIRLS